MAKAVPIHKLTQPDAALRDSAGVLLVRWQEMAEYAEVVRDPARVEELHNMRIAAKRLRYTLEIFAPALSRSVSSVIKTVTEIQEQLGSIHDLDVREPLLKETIQQEEKREHKRAMREGGGPPEVLAAEGLVPLLKRNREERERLYHAFIQFWDYIPPGKLYETLAQLVAPRSS